VDNRIRVAEDRHPSGMPDAANYPAHLAGRVFRASEQIGLGHLTREQLRSSQWRRLIRDVYADARLPADHGVLVTAARIVAPANATFCRLSAAWLYGIRVASAGEPAHLSVPRDSYFHRYNGLRVHRDDLPAQHMTRVKGFRVTTPARTAVDLARGPDLVSAVGHVDALLHAGITDLATVRDLLSRLPKIRGADRAARAFGLADERAESPLESRGRVVLVLGGLPVPAVQFEIHDNRGLVARVDLAYPHLRLAIEIDGAWHAASTQLAKDRRRLNRIVAAGWTVLHFTASDLYQRPAEVVAEVRQHISIRPIAG